MSLIWSAFLVTVGVALALLLLGALKWGAAFFVLFLSVRQDLKAKQAKELEAKKVLGERVGQ